MLCWETHKENWWKLRKLIVQIHLGSFFVQTCLLKLYVCLFVCMCVWAGGCVCFCVCVYVYLCACGSVCIEPGSCSCATQLSSPRGHHVREVSDAAPTDIYNNDICALLFPIVANIHLTVLPESEHFCIYINYIIWIQLRQYLIFGTPGYRMWIERTWGVQKMSRRLMNV